MIETTEALARGYRFSGIHCGIRSDPSRRDLALILSDRPAAAAGVFTQNRVAAAPVQVSRSRVPTESARGVIVCSGNANACTGEQGLRDAARMAEVTAFSVGCLPEQVLVCSTGMIGKILPMSALEAGIPRAAQELRSEATALNDAAHAILTTDTHAKIALRQMAIGGQQYIRLSGFAKGAAMIGPNMATMLGFIMTDAAVPPEPLQEILRQAVNKTFNCISVEGHMSTNDTVLLLANGAAGGPTLAGKELAAFADGVYAVCEELAMAIAGDAEGLSHRVTIRVEGLRNDEEARRIAKTVAESPLVKTAIFGADPNWGRIVSAAGYAGVEFRESDLSLWLGEYLLYRQGVPQPFDEAAASKFLKDNREVDLTLRFTLGPGACRFWTCDLGYEYIRLNAEYTT